MKKLLPPAPRSWLELIGAILLLLLSIGIIRWLILFS